MIIASELQAFALGISSGTVSQGSLLCTIGVTRLNSKHSMDLRQ